MTHEATRLAACPFCGAKSSQLIEDLIICYVECAECSVTGPARADADTAIEAWNRRAALAQPAPTAEVALPAVSEEVERVAFEAEAVCRTWAYRTDHGMWFYPSHDGGGDLWKGWLARAQSAAKGDAP